MMVEFLHATSQEFDVRDPQQAFHQSSGPVVYTYPGGYLHDKYTAWTKNRHIL